MTNPIAALSRRRLLSGLALSATAAAASAFPGEAATQAENPELLMLADQLPAIAGDHDAAKADFDQVIRKAHKVWPRAPEEITYWGAHSEPEHFIDGSGYSEGHKVLTDAAIDWRVNSDLAEADRLIAAGGPRRAKRAAWLKAEAPRFANRRKAARAYWREAERIRSDFDYERVSTRYRTAQEALRQHVNEIMMTREETIAGVVIKAQALATWSHTDPFWKAFNDLAPNWSDEIAASIMRQADPSGRPSGTGQ